jgi:CRP/FNR family transcriptional regulator, cyclic AMP receptor protein
MSTMEKISVLKSIDIFRTIPDEHLSDVASILKEREVTAGDAVIREGDLGTSMFIIVEGRVRVHRQEKDIAFLGSGDLFGELAALDPEPRAASVSAITDTFLFELDGSSLYALMSDRVEVVRGLIKILCSRVRSTLPN